MLSLFALLFKASYWQMLLRPATWSEAWVNLTRAHKDRRARKGLARLALLCLIPFICLFYGSWLFGAGGLFLLPVLGPLIWYQARWKKQNETPPPSIVPAPPPVYHELTVEEQKAFRQYFSDVGLLYAVMLDRAGSENFLRNKVLPEGVEVVTRRKHLDLLKSTGLWDKMAGQDREAMMAPDGHWAPELMHETVIGLEALRLIRWILRVDFYLPVIGQQLRLDYKVANELVREPGKLREGKELASFSMMETGRDAAEQYYLRCIAEQIHRGYIEGKGEDSTAWAERIATQLGGKEHEDFVLGQKLVSEVPREDLEWATMLSHRRWNFFRWTMQAMESGKPPEPPYSFYG